MANLTHSPSRCPSVAQHAHVRQGGQAAVLLSRLHLQQPFGEAVRTGVAVQNPALGRLGSISSAIGGISMNRDSSLLHGSNPTATAPVKDTDSPYVRRPELGASLDCKMSSQPMISPSAEQAVAVSTDRHALQADMFDTAEEASLQDFPSSPQISIEALDDFELEADMLDMMAEETFPQQRPSAPRTSSAPRHVHVRPGGKAAALSTRMHLQQPLGGTAGKKSPDRSLSPGAWVVSTAESAAFHSGKRTAGLVSKGRQLVKLLSIDQPVLPQAPRGPQPPVNQTAAARCPLS